MKFNMKTREGFTAETNYDPLGYPYEKSFNLVLESENSKNKEHAIKEEMTGYLRHTVFGTRMIIIYHYPRNLEEDKRSIRFILERKTKAKLKIKEVNDEVLAEE